jgi:hypothetical protein
MMNKTSRSSVVNVQILPLGMPKELAGNEGVCGKKANNIIEPSFIKWIFLHSHILSITVRSAKIALYINIPIFTFFFFKIL